MFPNKWFNLQYDGYSYILEYSINVTKKKKVSAILVCAQ